MKVALIATALLVGTPCALLADDTGVSPKSAPLGARLYGNAERGKDVVDMWCVSCHGTGLALDDRVPSLASLATNPLRTDGAIRAFLAQPHRPMPPLELSNQQIEDIVAYLHTLRPEKGQSR